MHIEKLTIQQFNDFQNNHPLSSYYQTINYALIKAETGYDYELIGYKDEDNSIKAATLILIKPIGIKCFYGYAPRGFLMDYSDKSLVNSFTKDLKNYYYEKNTIFIKLNPYIPIGQVNTNTFETDYNSNYEIRNILEEAGYKKLRDNLYFESILPRFNAFIDLKNFSLNKLEKNTKNKIRKGIRKGLVFKKYDKSYINNFYDLIKNKKEISEFYYQDYYTSFEKNDDIDLFLVSIDYYNFLQNSQIIYDKELERNTKCNERLINNNSEKLINKKMDSDKILLSYKNDIMEATKGMSEEKNEFIAGALVIKHNNIATIIFSGYDKEYKRFAPNYFLHYELINYYKDKFDYLDINGVVGDFKNDNPYSGLNKFKLGFLPKVYEYIGEYDLIIEPKSYDILLKNGILAKEFNKNK